MKACFEEPEYSSVCIVELARWYMVDIESHVSGSYTDIRRMYQYVNVFVLLAYDMFYW